MRSTVYFVFLDGINLNHLHYGVNYTTPFTFVHHLGRHMNAAVYYLYRRLLYFRINSSVVVNNGAAVCGILHSIISLYCVLAIFWFLAITCNGAVGYQRAISCLHKLCKGLFGTLLAFYRLWVHGYGSIILLLVKGRTLWRVQSVLLHERLKHLHIWYEKGSLISLYCQTMRRLETTLRYERSQALAERLTVLTVWIFVLYNVWSDGYSARYCAVHNFWTNWWYNALRKFTQSSFFMNVDWVYIRRTLLWEIVMVPCCIANLWRTGKNVLKGTFILLFQYFSTIWGDGLDAVRHFRVLVLLLSSCRYHPWCSCHRVWFAWAKCEQQPFLVLLCPFVYFPGIFLINILLSSMRQALMWVEGKKLNNADPPFIIFWKSCWTCMQMPRMILDPWYRAIRVR